MIKQKIRQIRIGWSETVIIIAFAVIIMWSYLKKRELDGNAGYTKGVITGTRKGAKGSVYLNFDFHVGDEKINSWSPLFKGWKIGDTIIIKYNKSKPHDNNIIKIVPKGERLD